MEITDRELLELIAAEVGGLKTDMKDMRTDISELKKTNAKIELTLENEIKPKMEVLFDGYIQNSDKLDRIEKEVSRHEEVILRKVR